MNGKFFDLGKEKQDNMINAALKIFALQGYRHASTDGIVREAGISKGLLFHYFENKLGVYTFVYDYSVRFMLLELRAAVDGKQRELFGLMKQVETARMKAMKAYPYMQQFLNRSGNENVSQAVDSVCEMRSLLQETYNRIYEQTDQSVLPPEVDAARLRKMMDFTIKGLMTESIQNASFQPEKLYEDIAGYLDMMKEIVYRE